MKPQRTMLIFVNLNVSLKDGAKHTDLYIKPTDDHQHLNCQSSHPHHIKVSIPYSQALRVSRICSSENDFRAHICKMKEWFLTRANPEKVVNDQIDKADLLRNPQKMVFLLWLHRTRKLKILVN